MAALGQVSTVEDPGDSKLMRWIRDHLDYQHDCCLIWPFGRTSHGYGSIGRNGHHIPVHRYICTLTHGDPPEGYQAAHSCGRGHDGCVNPRHLSWKTISENQRDRGPRGRRLKLSAEQVVEIRALKGLEQTTEIAARFGVTDANIRQIHDGKIWRTDKRDVQRFFSDDEVRSIRQAAGSPAELAERFKASTDQIRRIKDRRTYKAVPDSAERQPAQETP